MPDQRFTGPEYKEIKARKERGLRHMRASRPQTILEKLQAAMGAAGLVLYYMFFVVIVYAPLMFLGFPWWADILIIAAIMLIPFAGGLIELILWVWAFLLVVQLPVGLKVVLFYIGAFFYVAFELIPGIFSIFTDW